MVIAAQTESTVTASKQWFYSHQITFTDTAYTTADGTYDTCKLVPRHDPGSWWKVAAKKM
jgi:hypothetical protein|tara:strand:+ start:1262 stop:1441 length:180 start_codon:yes stop_codon:yes gene_type:complete